MLRAIPSVFGVAILALVATDRGWAVPLPKGLDGTVLQPSFEKGRAIYVVITTESSNTSKVMGQEVNQKHKQTITVRWRPEEQDKAGNWLVSLQIVGADGEVDVGGAKVKADQWKGTEFRLHIDKNMAIVKIDGAAQAAQKFDKNLAIFGAETQNLMIEDSVREMTEPLLAPATPRAVRARDTWQRQTRRNLGPMGEYHCTTEYRYDGLADDGDRVHGSTTLTYKLPGPDAKFGGEIGLKVTKGELSAKDSGGTLIFDRKLGRLVSSDVTLNIHGSLTMEVQGQTIDMELSATQRVQVRTYDRNPAEKK